MFLKASKEPLQTNFNPPVGLYEITTTQPQLQKQSQPSFQSMLNKHQHISVSQHQLDYGYVDYKQIGINLDDPLHSYATGKQRVLQNKRFQQMKHSKNNTNNDQIFDNRMSSRQSVKGKLFKYSMKNSKKSCGQFQLDVSALFLGAENEPEQKTVSVQHRKNPPKNQSMDSLELFMIREKVGSNPNPPGPGSYNISSVFDKSIKSNNKVQPLGRYSGREHEQIIKTDQSIIGVGSYNISIDTTQSKVMKFNQYSSRRTLFQNKNIPTFYDVQTTTKKPILTEFPPVFGTSSKR